MKNLRPRRPPTRLPYVWELTWLNDPDHHDVFPGGRAGVEVPREPKSDDDDSDDVPEGDDGFGGP